MRQPIKLFSSLLLAATTLLFCCNSKSDKQHSVSAVEAISINPSVNISQTRIKAKQALSYCKSKNFNTQFCILIDMSMHSGLKRFLVWDFKKDTFTHAFVVSHGCGGLFWSYALTKTKPKFSNEDGSHCSSLGKYKIGQRAASDWGINIKYVLHGLESTNSNALKRFIVLHSWEKIPDEEIYPDGTPEGWGCPSISNNSLKILDPILKASKKPVLLWIYN
jgi:hypothetical protein